LRHIDSPGRCSHQCITVSSVMASNSYLADKEEQAGISLYKCTAVPTPCLDMFIEPEIQQTISLEAQCKRQHRHNCAALRNSSIMCLYRPGFYAIRPHCFHKTFSPHSPPPNVDPYFFHYDQEVLDRRFPYGLPRDIQVCPCDGEDIWLWDIHPPRRADAEFTRYCLRCLKSVREHAGQTGSTPDWFSRDAGDNPGRIFWWTKQGSPG
jgi:hypothetical protein